MVVLSVAVLSKSGKVLVARQYVDMTRIRIEGLLAAFPKLIESDASPAGAAGSSGSGAGVSTGGGKQHTYVEAGSIRYVYQPIEQLYLVLVTTRGSNIVQDLDTLRLLSKVVPEYAVHATEEDVARNVFDLVFAFDEVVTMGYKESVTLDQIRTNLEMDSHNEKLHLMVQQSKMNEAKDEARRKAVSIKASKAAGAVSGIGNTPMPAGQVPGMMGSDSFGGMAGGTTGFGGSGISSSSAAPPVSTSTYGLSSSGGDAPTKSGGKLGKGLKLGSKGNKSLSVMQQMAQEEGIDASALVQQQSAQAKVAAPGAVVRTDPVEVRIAETVTVVYDKDGALQKLEIKGGVTLVCHEEGAKLRLQLQHAGETSQLFTFQPHPNLSRPEWTEQAALQLKSPDKPFPKDKPLQILRWRFAAREDEALVPLAVTCWPESNGDGTFTVNLELQLRLEQQLQLRDVHVSVPLGGGDAPEVSSADAGSYRHDNRKHRLEWEIPEVSAAAGTATATLEFVAAAGSEDDFFPVSVSFAAEQTVCPLELQGVAVLGGEHDGEQAKFGLSRQLTTERYEVVAQPE